MLEISAVVRRSQLRPMTAGGRSKVTTADRVLGVLGLFTIEKSEWTVEEAAKQMGIPVSTVYRYFRELSKTGFLDPFSCGKYVLGPAVIENDRTIRLTDPLIKVGRPALQRLIARSGGVGVALLCRIYRNRVMCVHQEPAALPENTISYERGRPMPMFRGASSKVIFANLPARTAHWFFETHKKEIAAAGLGSDWEMMKLNLRRIRKAGIHITRGEVDAGRVGIAAPVFGRDNIVIGSVTVAIPESEATPQFIANLSALVQATAREIDVGLQLLSPANTVQNPGCGPLHRELSNSQTGGIVDAPKTS
jgi:DNA-binding IclR family transcriptional regulator